MTAPGAVADPSDREGDQGGPRIALEHAALAIDRLGPLCWLLTTILSMPTPFVIAGGVGGHDPDFERRRIVRARGQDDVERRRLGAVPPVVTSAK